MKIYEIDDNWGLGPLAVVSADAAERAKSFKIDNRSDAKAWGFAITIPKEKAHVSPESAINGYVSRARYKVTRKELELEDAKKILAMALELRP